MAEHSFLILFGCDAATSLAWAILAWRVLPGTPADPPAGRPRRQGSGTGMLGDRRLVRLLGVTVLANLVLFQAQTTLPLWVHRQGLPETASLGLAQLIRSWRPSFMCHWPEACRLKWNFLPYRTRRRSGAAGRRMAAR